ncbi:MAG TPA: diacylglycerol kinase family protein [Alphaproteobacteria bacterium]|jgi:YegS/Rv2252/BmrU family lipid kinase|nr:diacylglycerol kinase family protein [Alphaproteobacteria bacterium]
MKQSPILEAGGDPRPRVRQVTVIFNPAAGRRRRRRLRRVLAALERRGVVVTLRVTMAPGDAERFAGEARLEECDRLVVAGGDGTINEALNGIADPAMPLAIVPLGTANVLAHEIGLGLGAGAAARAIVDGTPQRIALGRVDGRRFVMMAGIGFDAEVVARVDRRLKMAVGRLAYAIEVARKIVGDSPTAFELTIDGAAHRAYSAIVANGRHYGGPFVVAPEARLADPLLQVVLFKGGRRRDIVRYIVALVAGRLSRLNDVTMVLARRVEVRDPAGAPVQGDGDTLAHLPVAIDVVPQAMTIVMPAAIQ